jgi:dTMP kinase
VRGRFISLEGGEGAGKSTQARRLEGELRKRGLRVLLTREPGGSEGAEAVRALLMHGEQGRWGARAEALLFAAARADHVEKLIEPALASGAWVICDRFVDSTRAYQGASGIADADIRALHAFATDGLLPDRTILLALPPAHGVERATRRDGADADRFISRDVGFHERVGAAFDEIAAREPARVRRIVAAGGPEQVTDAILCELADLLP